MASSGSQKRNVVYGVPMGEPEGVQPVLQADLSGRTVVITGATGGLGLEAGKHFAKMRPKRMILTGRTEEKCREVEDSTSLPLLETMHAEPEDQRILGSHSQGNRVRCSRVLAARA